MAEKNKIELFSGVKTGLISLKRRGFFIAVGTGKTHAGLSNELVDNKIEDLFHATRCADQEKPKPDPSEVKNYRYINSDDLMKEINEKPYIFTPWFKICIDNVLKVKSIVKKNLISQN